MPKCCQEGVAKLCCCGQFHARSRGGRQERIPIFYLSVFKLLVGVGNCLDMLMSRSLWKGSWLGEGDGTSILGCSLQTNLYWGTRGVTAASYKSCPTKEVGR